MTRICFIGFGEAARAWCKTLRQTGEPVELHAFDIAFGSNRCAFEEAAVAVDARLYETAGAAISAANVVVSAVTASQCTAAAENAAQHLSPDHIYIDINSVSPNSKKRAARHIAESGSLYVDMAVMGPVSEAGHQGPVLVSGDVHGRTDRLLQKLQFNYESVGADPGTAAGIKMIRSLFVKGLEALTVQTLSAAAKSGCQDRVLELLSRSFPGLDWENFAAYQFERVAKHGVRRAAEMRESALTYGELGFPAGHDLAMAIADLQEAIGGNSIAGAATVSDWAEKTMGALEAKHD